MALWEKPKTASRAKSMRCRSTIGRALCCMVFMELKPTGCPHKGYAVDIVGQNVGAHKNTIQIFGYVEEEVHVL